MRLPMVILCFGVLMMSGCAANQEPQRVAVDLAPKRCPVIAEADVKALDRRPIAPPAGDLTKAKAQAWIDDLSLQVEGMRRAGLRVMRQYHRCRAGKTVAS